MQIYHSCQKLPILVTTDDTGNFRMLFIADNLRYFCDLNWPAVDLPCLGIPFTSGQDGCDGVNNTSTKRDGYVQKKEIKRDRVLKAFMFFFVAQDITVEVMPVLAFFLVKSTLIQGGPKKWHKVYGTIILQPHITESCGCQQNVLKEIFHMTRVSV